MIALERKVEAEYGRPLPPPAPPEPIIPHGKWREMWVPPYGKRATMLIIFNLFQTVGYYGFHSWVPTLLIKQGITITQSLLYTTIMALAAPLGPLIGLLIADRLERKWVIVAMAAVIAAAGLLFAQMTNASSSFFWVCNHPCRQSLSFTYHAYQQEIFPTGIRARAVGFVYRGAAFPQSLRHFLYHGCLSTSAYLLSLPFLPELI